MRLLRLRMREQAFCLALHLGSKQRAYDSGRNTFSEVRRDCGQRTGGDAGSAHRAGSARLPRRVFVLTSAPIWALWGERFLVLCRAAGCAFLPPGEKHKTLASVEKLLRQMAQAGGDRGSLLIAFGGGIVGDVGGFVAAIFMRGIRLCSGADDFSGAGGLVAWAARRA